jgi:hypothetical protein
MGVSVLGPHAYRLIAPSRQLRSSIEGFFGLPYLAHAADNQTVSLVGHFGLVM